MGHHRRHLVEWRYEIVSIFKARQNLRKRENLLKCYHGATLLGIIVVITRYIQLTRSQMPLENAKRVLVGLSKLCHDHSPECELVFSETTRLPESNSWATGFSRTLDEFEDQMTLFDWLRTTKFLSPLNVRTPFESVSGLFPLATQTTYLFVDFSGEKKPSSKLWPEETNVSPSLMD
ncbi:hypothetical protein EUGRSUZ_F01057 [Eucalyptus grandis]|uniref:Uncharacterized protein n=2 Tax=Eucalyptus grandis TaxID=71139 RepID=A0A059BMD0_EUCGR|nr:hypothetical protein EUGRSUZ_F01057 [Eucalyptus grandis]